MKHKIVYIAVTSMLLVACGGGSDSSNSQAKTFKVTTNVSGEGAVTPTQQNVEQGKTTTLNLSPKEGYKIASATGCNGILKDHVYMTGVINADCQIKVNFESQLNLDVPSELEVNSTFKANLKDLTTDWDSKVTEIDETKLSFSGNPKLVSGDVFVVKDAAYKVISVTGDTVGNTIVTVTQPELNEIYEKIEISGKMDALEFIPNPELLDEETPQARAITAKKGNIVANSNEDGFFTMQYGVSKNFKEYLLSSSGNLKVGVKANFDKWDVISNKGQGTVDVYLKPSILLSLGRGAATGKKYNEGVCSGKLANRKGGRIYLGAVPLGKMVGTTPQGKILSTLVNVNIPVCLPVNVSSNMKVDMLNFSGKYQTRITLGNQDTPKITNRNDLTVEMPLSTATLSEGTFVGTAKKVYAAEVKAEAGLEIGLEVTDKLSKFYGVGVTVAALAKPELKGTFGAALVSKNFSSILAEPDVCLELKSKAEVELKGFQKAFWHKEPLTITGTMPFPFVETTTKKWGLCEEETGFTKISATGQKLADSATEWSCVLDNKTGLIWERKTDSGVRSNRHGYSWFEDGTGFADKKDGFLATGRDYYFDYGYFCGKTLAKCNTKDFIQVVNNQKLCGYSDWRLPNENELSDVVVKNIDRTKFFEGGESEYTWSASTYDEDTHYAIAVAFGHGQDSGGIPIVGYLKYENIPIRAVRGK